MLPLPALADFVQFGDKLIGGDAAGTAAQGGSVALSGDGSTLLVGGQSDNNSIGAAWVFTYRSGKWIQQGAKLVAMDWVGRAFQGVSVALSADGNTALVGGPGDSSKAGAAWIFIRSGGVWSEQAKLVGSGAVGIAEQGYSVALSADGNTAALGGIDDSSGSGAVWIFARSGAAWSQQGPKLVALDAVGPATQGRSVALSGDGNTLLVGGSGDNSGAGAAWVWTRSGGAWDEQAKLIGAGAVDAAFQGISVALSADGSTAVVGGTGDSSSTGAAWVFARSSNVWFQQGAKLVGAGAAGAAEQGGSVALSADGNTALIGAENDNNFLGAVWAFTRSGGTWQQLGNKLVGSGATGSAFQGATALSGDGNTAVSGGRGDNNNAGAAWVFVQPAAKLLPTATHDFNGDEFSDIAWRHNGGTVAAWLMSFNFDIGKPLISFSGSYGVVSTTWQIVGQRDFNNDAKYDLLWRDGASGTVAIWLLNGLSLLQTGTLGAARTE